MNNLDALIAIYRSIDCNGFLTLEDDEITESNLISLLRENFGIVLYRFKQVVEKGDDQAVLRLLEDRGDRALFLDISFSDWTIAPTAVYLKTEVKQV